MESQLWKNALPFPPEKQEEKMEDSAVGTSQASTVSTPLVPHCEHGFSGTEVCNYEGGSNYLLLITPSCSPGLSTTPG